MIVSVILSMAALGCLLYAVVVQIKSVQLAQRLEIMLQAAISGNFVKQHFDESRLSKLETMLYHLLSAGNEQRQAIDKERSQIKVLISDISHQTKTPVANMKLYSELLCEQETLDEPAKDLARQVRFQADKLNFLISSLIKTSRLEAGIIAVAPKIQEISPLLKDLFMAYRPLAEEKKLRFTVTPAAFSAAYDPKWTFEAVSNVVDNAIKYTHAGGSVSVYAKEFESFVCITVSDTGIGIHESEYPKIFQRFYRSPDVAAEKGVGIGLYLTREIISKQGGYVTVKSAKGHGTEFNLFLAK